MRPGDPMGDTGLFGSRRQSREGGSGARGSFGVTSDEAFDWVDPGPFSSSARGQVDRGQNVNFFSGSRRVRPGEGVRSPNPKLCAHCPNPSTLASFEASAYSG
jgi:hypothetical protein